MPWALSFGLASPGSTSPPNVCILQSAISAPTIKHLKLVNQVVKRCQMHAKEYHLLIEPLPEPVRLITYADSSVATKDTSYSQEGILILLMHDPDLKLNKAITELTEEQTDLLSGPAHILHASSNKGRRVAVWSHCQTSRRRCCRRC